MLYALFHRLTHPRTLSAPPARRDSPLAGTARLALRAGLLTALVAGSALIAGVGVVYAAALADSTAAVLAVWLAGTAAATTIPRVSAWITYRLLGER